jgi:glycosyltransferase involved in cell wall biosynthesis
LSGGHVLYWNCGLPWEYSRSFHREFFERAVYLMVSYVVTGTEGLADRYAEEYALPRKKVLVMPNWIDTEETARIVYAKNEHDVRETYGVPNGPYVLFAHRLSERKGAQYIPEIYSLMPASTALVVAGDGPLRTRIKKQSVKEGGRDNIVFTGWVPHDDVLRLMKYAAAFIMPSDEEGFPHVVLEAMALGTQFVATSVGGVPEIVPRGIEGDLVPKGDMEKFNDELGRVLFMTEEMREMFGRETAAWVEQYDVKLVAKRFEELITLRF